MDFAKRLKQERIKLGYTQEVISGLCGVSTRTWSKYETGEQLPNTKTLFIITDVLSCSSDYLIGRVDNVPPHGTTTDGSKSPMDFMDDLSTIMNSGTSRAIASKTGLTKDKVYRIANGYPFTFDFSIISALSRLGYRLEICKKNMIKP